MVIIPALVLISGLVCFAILPVPLWVRAIILASDLFFAGLIWFLLWRRKN